MILSIHQHFVEQLNSEFKDKKGSTTVIITILTVQMEKSVEQAVGSAENFFSEDFVAKHGRMIVASLLGFVWMSSLNRQPADAQQALRGLLPQGFDRSILAARLQSRRTKLQVNEQLGIELLRSELRSPNCSKADKVRCLNELWRRLLTGLVSGVYLHALTIALFCVKNAVRVLCYVFQERERKERRRRLQKQQKPQEQGLSMPSNPVLPRGSNVLSTWWHHGWKGVMLNRMLHTQRMDGDMPDTDSASPFPINLMEEESRTASDYRGREQLPLPLGEVKGQHTNRALIKDGKQENAFRASRRSERCQDGALNLSATHPRGYYPNLTPLLHASSHNLPVSSRLQPWLECVESSSDLISALEDAFSVRACIEAAVPRVIASVEKVVASVFEADPSLEKTFGPTASVKQDDLAAFFESLMMAMDRTLCVEEWLTCPLSASSVFTPHKTASDAPLSHWEGRAGDLVEGGGVNAACDTRGIHPWDGRQMNRNEDHSKTPPEETDASLALHSEGRQVVALADNGEDKAQGGAMRDQEKDQVEEDDEDTEEVQFNELPLLQRKAAEAVAAHQQEQEDFLQGATDPFQEAARDSHGHEEDASRNPRTEGMESSLLPFPPPLPVPLPPLPDRSSFSHPLQTTSSPQSDAPTTAASGTSVQGYNREGEKSKLSIAHDFFRRKTSATSTSFFPAAEHFINAIRERMKVEEEMVEPISSLFLLSECFRHVIHTVSFSELVLVDGQHILRGLIKNATCLQNLRRFNPETNSAPMPMVVTYLEDLRQRLADENFVIPEYLSLFCSELVRYSTSRK